MILKNREEWKMHTIDEGIVIFNKYLKGLLGCENFMVVQSSRQAYTDNECVVSLIKFQ